MKAHPLSVAVLGVFTSLGITSHASADDAAELAMLRQRVDQLEARVATAAAIAQTQQRAELQSGHDGKGFLIASPDGNYTLRPGIIALFRHVAVYDQDDDSINDGFEIRRLRLLASGNVIDPKLTYRFMAETGRNSGDFSLRDAIVQYKFYEHWGIKLGQFSDPADHELLLAPVRTLAADISLNDFLIGGTTEDRVQGIGLTYGGYAKETNVNAQFLLTDGTRSLNTGFDSTSSDYGLIFRGEYKVMGSWTDYQDFTAITTKEPLLVVGTGTDYTGGADANVLTTSLDAQYEVARFSLSGEAHVRFTQPHTDADESLDYGFMAQAAYVVNERLEPFARYSFTRLDNLASGEDQVHEIAVGANYYFTPKTPHRLKATVDLTYLPSGAPVNLGSLGLGGPSDEAIIALRSQLTLEF